MNELKNEGFSDEMVKVCGMINEVLKNVSKDVVGLDNDNKKISKSVKSDIDKLKKEVDELKNMISNVKSALIEIDKKVKRKSHQDIREQAKPMKNKEEFKFIMSEMSDLKSSIKTIQQKLKLD